MTDDVVTIQTVTRKVPVPAERLFAILVDPRRHSEIDGSGMVRGAATTELVTDVGDVFTMDMNQPAFGDYQADNHVVELEQGRKIAWTTAGAGQEPLGHVWAWEFSSEGESTVVRHSCDWSGVTDPGLLAAINFPRVSADQMATTIDKLVAAAT
ncbi:MAG: SRPBCC domain-containing protein [Acidimicrobiales bacterium]